MRAPTPFITCTTSWKVTIEVSPGVVMARAPWAAPHSTDHCGSCPARKPYMRPEAKESPTDAVEDFQIFAILCLIELAIVIADGAPIVQRGGLGLAQRGGDDLERIVLHNFGDHLLKAFDFEGGVMLVHAGNFVAECGGKIFFVAEHDVDVGSDAAVHFLGLLFATKGFPKGCAVVQIVGDDDAVTLRGLHGFDGDIGRGGGKRAEDAASVKPARALLAEDVVPVDVAFFQVGDGGVAAIVGAERGAHAETALREVEAV